MTIEKRLVVLERQNRCMKVALIALLVACAVSVLLAASGFSWHTVHAEIQPLGMSTNSLRHFRLRFGK